MASEQQHEIEPVLKNAYEAGYLSRRQFLTSMLTAGLGLGGVAVLGACAAPAAPPAAATAVPAAATAAPAAATAAPTAAGAASGTRVLTPTFYQWIMDLHPSIP